MQVTVAGQDAGRRQSQGFTPGVGHLATGFFDKQSSRSKVPGGQLIFEKTAELAATDLAKV